MKTTVNISIEVELKKRAMEILKIRNQTFSNIVTKAIEELIEDHIKTKYKGVDKDRSVI